MRAMRTSFLAGLLLCTAISAAAQQWRPRAAEPLPPLFAPVFVTASPAPFPSLAPEHEAFRPFARRSSERERDGREFNFDFAPSFLQDSRSPQDSIFRAQLPGPASLHITAEQTSFLTESRIALAELWRGRLRVSGVQQRFHSANLFSVVNPNWARDIALAPGAESIVGRSRVNYGLGLQLRFDP